MDQKDEFEPPVVLHAQKPSNSSISPDRTAPALRPPNVFFPGDDFIIWSFRARSYLKAVPVSQYGHQLDDSAARQLLSTGTQIEAPPATLWAILDDLFNIRQPTLLQLERFRERKQLPGESMDQILGSLKDLATNIYAVEDRIKIEELEPQRHALKISADPGPRQLPPGNRNNRPGSRMNCPCFSRFGRRAQRWGHKHIIRPISEPLPFCNSIPIISHISHSTPPLTISGYLAKRPGRFLVDTGVSCSLVGARKFWQWWSSADSQHEIFDSE
ncbi:hypothetical protein X801_04812, partial [Opisthorchis viverrini]